MQIENLTNEELVQVAHEIEQELPDENAIIRKLAIQFFGIDDIKSMLIIELKLLPLFAERFVTLTEKQKDKKMNKTLSFWKQNAENSYPHVPICVLRYISELEKALEQ